MQCYAKCFSSFHTYSIYNFLFNFNLISVWIFQDSCVKKLKKSEVTSCSSNVLCVIVSYSHKPPS